LNVTEVRDSDFKNAFPEIFDFTVGILKLVDIENSQFLLVRPKSGESRFCGFEMIGNDIKLAPFSSKLHIKNRHLNFCVGVQARQIDISSIYYTNKYLFINKIKYIKRAGLFMEILFHGQSIDSKSDHWL